MTVHYTPRALADLESIFTYLDTHSPGGVRNVLARIRKALAALDREPRRGQATDRADVRRLPVVRYRYAVYFRARGADVEIIHIRHTSRRLPEAGEL